MNRTRLLILPDFRQEQWPSMDLCAEMLFSQMSRRDDVAVDMYTPQFRRVWSSLLPGSIPRNADRLRNRMRHYPRKVRSLVTSADCFHVADHSYSQLLHELPPGRAGVFCHDLDTFKCVLNPQSDPRPQWFRRMTRRILDGFGKAAVVFHSTEAVRQQILAHGLVGGAQLVKAPYGVADEFFRPSADQEAMPFAAEPFILHVGSCIRRKRIDLLLGVFEVLAQDDPHLRLVQVGGEWTPGQREQLRRLPAGRINQIRGLSRPALAWLYHRSRLVLMPSDAEGFGLPVIEALAAGAVVVASDVAPLREVGGLAVTYCRAGDLGSWIEQTRAILRGGQCVPAAQVRRAQAEKYAWSTHAEIIARSYIELVRRSR